MTMPPINLLGQSTSLSLRATRLLIIAAFALAATSVERSALAANAPPINELASGLLAKVMQDPENYDDWLLLTQSYLYLREEINARRAFERTHALANDADRLVRLAYAVEKHAGLLGVSADDLVQRALEIDPENQSAGQWNARLLDDPPDAPSIMELNAILQGTAARSAEPRADDAAALTVRVSLADSLRNSVNPDDAVFVLVRPTSSRAPLGVVRRKASQLPFEVSFDESTAMIPGQNLATHTGPVEIVARVSFSGDAISRSGDLQGLVNQSDTHGASGTVDLTIDHTLP